MDKTASQPLSVRRVLFPNLFLVDVFLEKSIAQCHKKQYISTMQWLQLLSILAQSLKRIQVEFVTDI